MTDPKPTLTEYDDDRALIGVGDTPTFGLTAEDPTDPTGLTRAHALVMYETREAAVHDYMLAARALTMARDLRRDPVTCPSCGSNRVALLIPVPAGPDEAIMQPPAHAVCRDCP